MAEQLGAGRPAPSSAGPDWAQQAQSTSAPAWAAAGAGARGQDRPGRRSGEGVGDAPSDDDEDLASSGAVGQPVIESVLGGTVIAIDDDPVA